MSYQSQNTSSAYKLDAMPGAFSRSEVQRRTSKPKKVNKKAEFVRKVKKYAMTAAILVLAFMIVRGYVAIDEMSGNISSLKKEYNSVVAENQAIKAEIDKSLDLEELQKVATEEYGMTRPDRSQVYYVDMGLCDSGAVIASNDGEKEEPSLTGASGMLVDSMNIFD